MQGIIVETIDRTNLAIRSVDGLKQFHFTGRGVVRKGH